MKAMEVAMELAMEVATCDGAGDGARAHVRRESKGEKRDIDAGLIAMEVSMFSVCASLLEGKT